MNFICSPKNKVTDKLFVYNSYIYIYIYIYIKLKKLDKLSFNYYIFISAGHSIRETNLFR